MRIFRIAAICIAALSVCVATAAAYAPKNVVRDVLLTLEGYHVHRASSCTATPIVKDSMTLTAAFMGGNWGPSDALDGTGCNIVAYYGPGTTGWLHGSQAFGANYYGVVVDGATVNILRNAAIHDIGESPFNGDQHGVGVYCNPASSQASKLNIVGDKFWNIQKTDIVVLGANCSGATVAYNQLQGFGPINFIASNGIEYGLGAKNLVIRFNQLFGFSYTGPGEASSGAILGIGGDCFGGPVQSNNDVEYNMAGNSDVLMYNYNLDASCETAQTASGATDNIVENNFFDNDAVTNTTGDGSGPYQVGVADASDGDFVQFNNTCGRGTNKNYAPPNGFIARVDFSGSVNLTTKKNSCFLSLSASDAAEEALGNAPVRTAAVRGSRRIPSPYLPDQYRSRMRS